MIQKMLSIKPQKILLILVIGLFALYVFSFLNSIHYNISGYLSYGRLWDGHTRYDQYKEEFTIYT